MFTLGADPEFIFVRGDRVVSASNYLRYHGVVGTDGCNSTGELRPGIAQSPIELVAMLAQGITRLATIARREGCDVWAGHYPCGVSLGGHLHFGVPYRDEMSWALYRFLDPFSDAVDDLGQRNARIRCGYGKGNREIEQNSWGFEYRVPGSWILSPAIALATITLGKLAVQQYTAINEGALPRELPLTDEDVLGVEAAERLVCRARPSWEQDLLPYWEAA